MYHSIKMILIFQMCLVEADQQQIIEVIFFCFESWDNRNLQLSFTRELNKRATTRESLQIINGKVL